MRLFSIKALAITTLTLVVGLAQAELQPEPIPSVATLPAVYPDTWLFAHDVNFNSMIAGKVAIIDVAADTQEFKGFVDASMMAFLIAAALRTSRKSRSASLRVG